MTLDSLIQAIVDALDDKKGRDIVVLNLKGLSEVADTLVVCHGTSDTQVKALADHVQEEVRKKTGEKAWKKEGVSGRTWIILDYVTIVVHIFTEEKRHYYGIERMWNDAERFEQPA